MQNTLRKHTELNRKTLSANGYGLISDQNELEVWTCSASC